MLTDTHLSYKEEDMKFRLKQFIETTGVDRVVSSELRVQAGIVYLDTGIHFKYMNGNWYQLCEGVWVNLQGGVPDYERDTMLDELLFYAVEA